MHGRDLGFVSKNELFGVTFVLSESFRLLEIQVCDLAVKKLVIFQRHLHATMWAISLEEVDE